MERRGTLRLAGALVVVLLFASVPVVATGTGTGTGIPGQADAAVSALPTMAQTGTPTPDAANNSSVQHENPEAVDEAGDLDAVTGWLAGRMAQRLQGSTLALSQGEYERARQVVGDEYDDRLAQFVDVAGETEGTDDDATGEALRAAKTDQREYASTVRQYRRTLERYREARRAGDTAEARQLARELDRYATTVVGTGRSLQGHYATIGNQTDTDLAAERRTIANVSDSVSEQQADIRADLFVETTLQVRPRERAVSFQSPLVLEGRLQAANGTALADRQIALQVGNRTLTTRTDGRGAFAVRYRPVGLPAGEQSLAVRYRPRNASVYLGDRATVTVRVDPVTPTLSLEREPGTVRYGESLTLSGTVRAAETSVPRVPVVLSVDGRRLGVVRTDANGTFASQTTLPADVSVGEVRGRARVAFEDRAIARTATNTSVRIRATPTRLSLDATALDDGALAVDGRLVTADGRPVSDQPVSLRVNGSVRETLVTDETGAFDATVSALDRVSGMENETVTLQVAARFDGRGTNLNASRDQLSVTLAVPADAGDSADENARGQGGLGAASAIVTRWLPTGFWPALGLALVLVVLVGGVVLRRRQGGAESESVSGDGDRSQPAVESTDSTPDAPGHHLAGAATERLEAGDPDGAIELAYLGLRRTLGSTIEVEGAHTHWEFLDACQASGLDDGRLAAIETVTEAYEQAVFAPTAVDPDRARRVIDLVVSTREDG